jgi:Barstar (barnase inhibitor)
LDYRDTLRSTMAPFGESDLYQNPLDYCILRDGGIALYRRPEFLAEDIEWLTNRKYQVYSFDCQKWVSGEAMHLDLTTVLSVPGYFGRNLDALRDSLSDLAVPDVGGSALMLRRFDAYSKGEGAAMLPSGRTEAEEVLDILAGTSRYFLLTGKRFVVLVQSDDPTLRYERLGGRSAQWNRREWLDKDRGL